MTFPKAFQRPPLPITRADTPLDVLERRLAEQTPDPLVGLNPTGRPRRPSAPSRRKHARRTATEETP